MAQTHVRHRADVEPRHPASGPPRPAARGPDRGSLDRAPGGTRPGAGELGGLAVLLAAFSAAVVPMVVLDAALLHDEAAYAVWARHWLEGGPLTGVSAHRAPGIPAAAAAVLLVSDAEAALRLLGLVSGLAAIVSVWWLGRTMAGPGVGLGAAAVFATATPVLRQSALLMTDVLATALVAVALAVAWRELDRRPRATWRLLWVAPLAAAAFYVRYGTLVVLVAVAAGALVAWLPRLARAWRQLAVTAAALLALLTPHLVLAAVDLGSPLERLTSARRYNGLAGVWAYLQEVPTGLAGPLLGAAVLVAVPVAVAGLGRALALRRWQASDRVRAFVLVTAATHVTVVGINSNPRPRYLLVSLALLGVLAAVEAATALRWLRSRTGTGTALAAAALVAVVAAFGVANVQAVRSEARELAPAFAEVRAAGRYLAEHADRPCAVATSYDPQMTWYSGCASYSFDGGQSHRALGGHLFLIDNGKRQPEGAALQAWLAHVDEPPVVFRDSLPSHRLGDAALYRLRD